MPSPAHRLLFVFSALSLLSACSFGMTKVQRDLGPTEPPHCSDSLVPPVVDGVITVGAGAGALYVQSAVDDPAFVDLRRAGVTVLLITGIAYAISTGYGVVQQRRCTSAKDAYYRRTGTQPPG